MENNSSNHGLSKSVSLVIKIFMTTIMLSTTLIEILEQRIKNNDDKNSCLLEVIKKCNQLYLIYTSLPDDENGIIFKEQYNKIVKEHLENKICVIIDNNNKDKNVNCFTFYENNLKKSAVNKELLSKIKPQKGGIFGIKNTVLVAALACLGFMSSLAPEIKANTVSVDNFVKQKVNLVETKTVEYKQYLFLHNNFVFGTCAQNAYMAEFCGGGYPTIEEWKAADPTAISRMPQAYILKSVDDYGLRIGPNTDLTMGADIEKIYGEKFTIVPSDKGQDPNWFREYFKSGENTPQAKESKAAGSNIAITTVTNRGHAYNMMYNRDNGKLCLNDENRGVENMPFWGLTGGFKTQYFCEEGFWSKDELEAMNFKIWYIVNVVPEGVNLFEVAAKNNKNLARPVDKIRQVEKIFEYDNSEHKGTLKDYIELHNIMHESIITGDEYNVKAFKSFAKEVNDPSLTKIVNIYEKDHDNKKKGLLLYETNNIPHIDTIASQHQKNVEDIQKIYGNVLGTSNYYEAKSTADYEPGTVSATSSLYGNSGWSSIAMPSDYSSLYGSTNNSTSIGGKIKNKKMCSRNKKNKYKNKKTKKNKRKTMKHNKK